MGNRGKNTPNKKSTSQKTDLPEKNKAPAPASETPSHKKKPIVNTHKPSSSSKGSCKTPEKAKLNTEVRIIISPKCKRLADQALLRNSSKETVRAPGSRRSLRRNPPQRPNRPEVALSPRRNLRRRKALVQALKSLRNHPQKKVASPQSKPKNKNSKRIVPRSSSSSCPLRTLRPRGREQKPKVKAPEVAPVKLRESPRKKQKMETEKNQADTSEIPNTSQDNQAMEVQDDEIRDSPSKTEYNEMNDPDPGSDSSDDVQLPILDKAPALDKETEDESDEEDDSTNLPDSDYESSLLSPSALPASSLFKYPKKKGDEKAVSPVHASSSSMRFSPPHKLPAKPPPYKKTVSVLNRSELPSTSRLPMSYSFSNNMSSFSGGSYFMQSSNKSSPTKRGRGRPRKPLQDVKSVSGKLYRQKLEKVAARSSNGNSRDETFAFHYPQDANLSSTSSYSHLSSIPNYEQPSTHHGVKKKVTSTSPSSDPLAFRKRLHRWKDRSTFVYAKHKFSKDTANKFRCETCDVYFTALSSLKRHYGTIYHKQQLGLSQNHSSSSVGGPESGPATQSSCSQNRRVAPGAGPGKRFGPEVLPRTSSFIRKNAASNIKKYYAAADAARRFKAAGKVTSSSTNGNSYSAWLQQKQQRQRKPLHHSDYVYPSGSSADSDEDGFERRRSGRYSMDSNRDDDIENNYPGEDENEDEDFLNNGLGLERNAEQKSWLSNAWKGTGSPHFTCEVCSEAFEKKLEFTKHLFEHRQEDEKKQSMTCPDCQTPFPNEILLGNHFKLFNHGPEGNEKRMKRYICYKCNSAFSQRNYYKTHLESHKRPLIKCPHCPAEFTYKFYLSDHIKEEHDGWSYNNNGNGPVLVPGAIVPGPTNLAVATISSTPLPSSSVGATGTGAGTKSGKKVELYSSTTTFIPAENSGKGKRKSSAASEEGGKRKSGGKGKSNVGNNHGQGHNAKSVYEYPSNSNEAFVDELICMGLPTSFQQQQPEDKLALNEAGASEPKETARVNLMEKYFPEHEHEKKGEIVEEVSEPNTNAAVLTSDSKNTEAEEAQSKNSRTDWRANEEIVLSTNSVPVSSVEQSTAGGGKIVFQFNMPMPLSTDSSIFEGFDLNLKGTGGLDSSVSPLTIEIPRDNINLEEKDPLAQAEVEPVATASDEGKEKEEEMLVEGDDDDTRQEDPLETASNALAKLADSEMNMPLMGCGGNWNILTKPDENGLTCQDCGKVFEHRKSLVKHVQYYRQSDDFPCKLCNKTFKLKHHVSRHMKSFHNVDTNSSTTSSTTSEDQVEGDFLSSPTGVGTSGLLSVPPVPIPVPNEGIGSSSGGDGKVSKPSTSTSASSTSTTTTASGTSAPTSPTKTGKSNTPNSKPYTTVLDDNGKTIFKCLVCFKLYPTKPQLNSHLWYHNKKIASARSKEKFPCDLCPDKRFTWRKDLLRHKREKHGIYSKRTTGEGSSDAGSDGRSQPQPQPSPKRCSHCPMVFPAEIDLNEHIAQEHKDLDKKGKQEPELEKKGEVKGHDEDKDRPPTPSLHISPDFPVISKGEHEDDEDDDDDDLDDEEPDSPEFELLELN